MAGALIIRPSLGFSCSTRAFDAVVHELESDKSMQPELGAILEDARLIGAVSVSNRPSSDALEFLDAITRASERIAGRADAPAWWSYGPDDWGSVRDLMPELRAFVDRARIELGRRGLD